MSRKKSIDHNRKEPSLRQKRLRNGGYLLNLDIYWNGKRSYDFLKLYLNPPTDDLAVIENKTTLELVKTNQVQKKDVISLIQRSLILQWCHSYILFEYARKMLGMFITNGIGDLSN